jgi:hypothetical protein
MDASMNKASPAKHQQQQAHPSHFDGTSNLKKQLAYKDAVIQEKDEQIANLVLTVEKLQKQLKYASV